MTDPTPNSFPSPLPQLPLGQHLPAGHGLDPPTPAATSNYLLNHLMIRIRDPAESLHFYVDLMGLRTIFAMNAGPFTIYYLGHPRTDEHRADPQRYARETVPHDVLIRTAGLLELYHLHGTEKLTPEEFRREYLGNVQPVPLPDGAGAATIGFGHLGFTVPDVPAALERLKRNGVKVWKDLGVATRASVPLREEESSKDGVAQGELHENYKMIYKQMAFVVDPVSFLSFFCFYFRGPVVDADGG